ncbi:MAG: 5-bromo-4-chloroindolyl phosphate hydrolysis family protein [Lachnospiraceae bacterium]|nr:5-bromo-4-chloroindolyl phosphate hydrolysis family protein [Lachnospiraceae bacterium]
MALIDDLLSAGDDIIASIDKALSTHEYSGLGTQLRRVVSDTTTTVVKSGVGAMADVVRSVKRNVPYRPPFFTKDVEKNLGKFEIGTGTAISIVSGALMCWGIFTKMIAGSVAGMITIGVVMGLIFLIGIGVILSGINKQKLVKSFYQYGAITGERSYVTIRELADKSDKKEDQVLSELKKMKMKGFLPTAVFDREQTTLMLTDDVYMEYARSVRMAQEQAVRDGQKAAKEAPRTEATKRSYYKIDESLPEDVKSILRDGNDYLNKIRDYNDMIPDTESMSDKLYTLEATVLSIFKKVQKQPETASDLRKFMSYYLPTTEKLVTSYVKLCNEDGSIENVKNAKVEIEDAMDVINDAYVKLLNQLFQDDAWDISSDISVMKTMMKQDALL